jgi:hypothetical protein
MSKIGKWVQKARDCQLNELFRDPPPVITAASRFALVVVLLIVIIIAMFLMSGSGSNGTTDAFQIFFLLVVLGGSVGSVAYWLMKHDLYESLDRHMEEKAAEITRERVDYSSKLAEARALQGVSFTFFENYQPALNTILEGENPSDFTSIKHIVALAKNLTSHALERFQNPPLAHAINKTERSSAELSKDDKLTFERYVRLLNHSIYHAMAECAFEAGVRQSEEGTPVINEEHLPETQDYSAVAWRVHRNVYLLDDSRLGKRVYEFQDTLGICLALSPDPSDREKGKQLLRNIIAGRSPSWGDPADRVWRVKRWGKHNSQFKLNMERPA